MKRAKDLTLVEAQDLIDNMVNFLYWDHEEERWVPDQEVNGGDLVDFLCTQMNMLGLAPTGGDVPPPPGEGVPAGSPGGSYAVYRDACPACGMYLQVYEVTLVRTGETHKILAPLEKDGFEFDAGDGGKDMSTENEKVRCIECGETYDLGDLTL